MQLSYHIRLDHENDTDAAAVLTRETHRDAEQRAVRQRCEEERRAIARKPGEPMLPLRPPLPTPYFADVDPVQAFGNERTFEFYAREELLATSDADAPKAIATEQKHTAGSHMPLLMDARYGLKPQRAILDGLLDQLGLRFRTRQLMVELVPGQPAVAVLMHYRVLAEVARFLFRFVTPEHCRPRKLFDAASGERVYSDPYTADAMHDLCREIQEGDPNAIVLATKLYWDDTNLTKNGERTACPVSVTNLALPLESVRQPANGLLLSYFSQLPESVMLELSDSRKTAARKALHHAQVRTLFDSVGDTSMVALAGMSAVGAHGRAETVYPVVLGLSLDYPKIASVTQTLQNQACWLCRARQGHGFWSHQEYDLRTRDSERALIGRAWASNPTSHAARARMLQPFGLHPHPNPCFNVVGLDVFQGTAIPLLHFTYHGPGKELVEHAFNTIQKQTTRAEFAALGRKIDAWVVAKVVPTHMLKSSFARGISHYLYGAYFDVHNPWDSTIKFGQARRDSAEIPRDFAEIPPRFRRDSLRFA